MAELHPDPDRIRRFRLQYESLRPRNATVEATYSLGWMDSWTHQVAEKHGKTCAGCWLCDALVGALSLFAAFSISNPPPPEYLRNYPHRGDRPD